MWETLWPLLQTLLIIILIIGVAYLFTKYVVGKGGAGMFARAGGAGNMKVLSRLPLGKDQQLLMVQAGERYFLIGVTQAGMSALAEYTPEEAEAWKEAADSPEGDKTPNFREALQTVLKQRKQR